MESSPQINPTEQLNFCLNNLFQGPSQGIEKAFSLILDLLKKQQDEHRELQSAHLELDKKHQDLSAKVKNDSNYSNEAFLDKFTDELNSVKESVEVLRKERDEFSDVTNEIKNQQKDFQTMLNNMNKEVKTMAYNLQLETVPDISGQDESKVEDSKSDSLSVDNDSSENDEDEIEAEKSCHNDESGSITSDDDDKNESPTQELPSLTPLMSNTSKKESDRKGSVTTRKLQLHETLAARLDRIEGDKDKVKLELLNLKKMVERMNVCNEPLSTTSIHSEESLSEIQQRLVSLEKFLCGFGATIFDTIDENVSQEDEILNDNTIITEAQTNSHDETSNDDSNKRKLDEDSSLESNEIDDPNSEEISTTSIHKTDDSNVTLTMSKTNDDEPNSESKESFGKSRGLLMHLLDQEQRFKENLRSMMTRIMKLEEEINTRVDSGGSLGNVSSEGGDVIANENSNTKSFDDTILIGQIEEMRSALDELRTELNSKLSEQRKLAQLELQHSSDDLKEMEGGNKQVDEAVLKRLHHVLQNEIELLREEKLDKDSFTIEMEECKQNLTNTFSKSLSNQDSKLINNVTKLEIDISECRESMRVLESVVETKFSDGEEFNLDEKIKNATDAMESSLQETILSRLNCLKAMEDEVEKIASGLTEKPDQDQINTMLQNLEKEVMQRLGSDEAFQSIIESMKKELQQKMTKNEVLYLLKQMLSGAKEDVRRSGENSLMIGHQSYRCLSCNEVNPMGVNNRLATRVNHNSLPVGRGLAPAVYPYCAATGGGQRSKLPLRPLRRSQTNCDTLRRASRRWTASGQKKYTRRSR